MIKFNSYKVKKPKLLFLYAIVITISLITFIGVHTKNVLNNARKNFVHIQTAQNYTSNIFFYDEVLTNTALLAATSGNLQWEKKYRLFEPKLENAIKNTIKLDSTGILHQKLIEINKANRKLVAMENRTFELVHNKKLTEAQALINSNEYEKQKAIYAEALFAFKKIHEQETANQQALWQQKVKNTEWYFLFFIIGFILLWLKIENMLHKNGKQISKVQEQLKESVKASGVGLWDWNLQTNEVYQSPEWKKQIGYNDDELKSGNEAYKEHLHPDDIKEAEEQIKSILEGKQDLFEIEYRFRHKDGSYRWMFGRASIKRDHHGKPMRLYGSHVDITEIKLAAEEIKKSETKFKTLYESIDDAIFVLKDGVFLESNSKVYKMFGCSKEDVIGESVFKFSPEKQPDGRLSSEKGMEKVNAALGGETQRFEWTHCRFNGSLFDTEMSLNKLELDGVVFLQAIIRDITERKQAEEKIKILAHAVQSTQESVVLTDKNYVINFVNDSFLKTYGYKKEEIINQHISFIHSVNNNPEVIKEILTHLEKKESWHGEVLNTTKDGRDFPIALSISPILDEGGEIISFGAIQRDITEQKKREDDIIKMNATLERKVDERTKQLSLINENLNSEIEERIRAAKALANAKVELDLATESKNEFFSRVSHELRTPLNGILGFAQLLEMGDLDSRHKKGVSQILKSGKQMLELVNEVLELSKTDSSKFTISMEPINLKGIIKETIEINQPFADESDVKIKFENSEGKDLFVKADYQKLMKVLSNILNNAIKYNKKGGLVTVKTAETQDNNIRISITDTGTGVAAEELHKLFMPFQRIGTEISILEGTGLGLAVAKKLTETMNGTIGAESEMGTGSTFWIELPKMEESLKEYQSKSVFKKY
jgi:PAS domain S-box-containing protein